MLRILAACFAAALAACAGAPAAEELREVAPGVSVFGASVGGLTSEPARSQIQRAFARPIVIAYAGQTFSVSPTQLGAKAGVDAAIRSALSATPRSTIGLPVTFSQAAVQRLVSTLAWRYDRKPVSATVKGANASGPVFQPARDGVEVLKDAMEAEITHELTGGSRAPLRLATAAIAPAKTQTRFGPVIVVNRAENTLKLYDSQRLIRTIPVATGQSIYPTPPGIFKIVDKQKNPWWYPPTYDAWAHGLKPVPPGPDNPLGTRWMGLSVPGVGIHGTDEPTSIGYSASHGCIRMHVPDAEWLFNRVATGTPVVIE
ncbi:MAG TPA: L,D-transpeptidase family protein [Gaiellaceae bacterium]|nr:L,D-transpeptidase family protein [Gaiellaceae bacterium]